MQSRLWAVASAGLVLTTLLATFVASRADEPSIEDLEGRVANANIPDRPPLCIRISERLLDLADRLYIAGESEKGQVALSEVIAYAELARDYAIQSHRHEKQAEIAIRKMAHKLVDMKHTVSHEDQEQVQKTIDRLQRIRDDLLEALFSKGGK